MKWDFTVSMCSSSLYIATTFAEHAKTAKGYAVLVILDVDDNSETAEVFDSRSMSAFEFYKSESKVHEI